MVISSTQNLLNMHVMHGMQVCFQQSQYGYQQNIQGQFIVGPTLSHNCRVGLLYTPGNSPNLLKSSDIHRVRQYGILHTSGSSTNPSTIDGLSEGYIAHTGRSTRDCCTHLGAHPNNHQWVYCTHQGAHPMVITGVLKSCYA